MQQHILDLIYIGGMMADWTEELTDQQKSNIMDLIVTTVKEIRQQIDQDILFTQQIWERKGFLKSRRTRKAFEACRAIVQGKNEIFSDINEK
jgi:predicted esterase YcpF (UPF0227 family)